MKTFVKLLLVAAVTLPSSDSRAQDWQLVWADEFDGSEVDLAKWEFQLGDGCPDLCGWGNGEEQYYTADNTSVEGGVLRIVVREEEVGGRSYTSSRLRTLGKASWTYGRVEVRAKMPGGSGFWPAVWLLPSDEAYGAWAASGEIDLLEVFGTDPQTVYGTVHYGGESPQNTYEGGSFTLASGDFATDFHEFAIEWVPGEIRWYVDGVLYHTQNRWYSTAGRFPAPFDQPFHLLLNVAMGGAGGTPDATTTLPQSMDVDYVRVYQSENAVPTVTLDPALDGYSPQVGSDLTLSASATDADGTISRVLFFAGDAILGIDEAPPYEIVVGPVAEGCYDIRALAVDNLGGMTWSDPARITGGSCAQAPYLVSPPTVPGTIEVEHYDLGGDGVAYHDVDSVNGGSPEGGGFRLDEGVDVDYALGSRQGFYVTDFSAGEWLEYTVDVAEAGAYLLELRGSAESEAMVSLLAGSTELVSGLPVTAGPLDGFRTFFSSGFALEAGTQVLRLRVDQGTARLDNMIIKVDPDAPVTGTFTVEDFGASSLADFGFFGSVEGEITSDDGTNPFMRARYSGSGGSGTAFYGVIWRNFDNSEQITIPADPWFSARVRHSSSTTTVERYAFEITLREDTDGNGWTNGSEDSHRLDTFFDAASFTDEWIQISVPLSDFVDLTTGGNGVLEKSLDEIVFVVSQVTGPNPSAVEIDIDDVVLSSGQLATGRSRFEVPVGVRLDPPYPSPARSAVSVGIELDSPARVTMDLYDVLGRRVRSVVDAYWSPGPRLVRLDVASLSPGVYVLHLLAGRHSLTRNLVVAR